MKGYEHDFVDLRGKTLQHASLRYKNRDLSKVNKIALHHSGAEGTIDGHARYHVETKGWPGIAYHIHIDRKGKVSWLNDLEKFTYHCGKENGNTVGVCLEGNLSKKGLTELQKKSLVDVVGYLMNRLNISLSNVKGHKELLGAATECPGVSCDSLRSLIGKGLEVKPKASEKVVDGRKGIGIAEVLVDGLALRYLPSVKGMLARRLGKGEKYFVYAIEDGWYNLGGNRWASNVDNKYMKFSKHLETEKEYVVTKGDTLTGIGKKYGLTVTELKKKNGLKDSKIYVGDVLKI
jgi:LysM repeat protein